MNLTLDYSPPPRPWRRWRRRLIWLIVLLAVGLSIYLNWQSLKWRASWLYWSHECAAHIMKPGTVLSEFDPQRARQLLATNSDYVASGGAAVYSPKAWRTLGQLDGRCNWISRDLYGVVRIAFMGSLRRPDGESRLVIISGDGFNGYDLLADSKVIVLPHPGLFESRPQRSRGGGFAYSGLYRPVTLTGGTIDPADASHVIFQFALPDESHPEITVATGEIDAYLMGDDSVRFKLQMTPQLAKLRVQLRRTMIYGLDWQKVVPW